MSKLRWINVKDELPKDFQTYDFKGDEVTASDIVMTNKGAAAMVDGEWLSADWDVKESGRYLHGVTHWIKEEADL